MKLDQVGPQRRAEIIRLYTAEKFGIKAIGRYMSGGITLANIRTILVEAGVYQGNERPMKIARERREQVVRDEKASRQRMAGCLWQLRKGIGVETTCQQRGWNRKSIWNDLRTRKSYWRLKGRLEVKYPQNRVNHRRYEWVSRIYGFEAIVRGSYRGGVHAFRHRLRAGTRCESRAVPRRLPHLWDAGGVQDGRDNGSDEQGARPMLDLQGSRR